MLPSKIPNTCTHLCLCTKSLLSTSARKFLQLYTKCPACVLITNNYCRRVSKTKSCISTGLAESAAACSEEIRSEVSTIITGMGKNVKCTTTVPEKKTSEGEKLPEQKTPEKAPEKAPEKGAEAPEAGTDKVPAKAPGNAANNLQMNVAALLPISLVLLKFY